jgi:hypothetical protein
MVESSLAWCRGTQRRGRGGEVPALLLLPRDGVPARLPQMAPGAAPSNGSRCVGGDAMLGPASFFPPLASPTPPLSPSCGGGPGKGKTPNRLGLREGARSRGFMRLVKRGKGKYTAARPGCSARRGRRRGDTAMGGDVTLGVAVEGHMGLFPWGDPEAGTWASPGSACMSVGGPAFSSHGRAIAARRGRLLGRKEEDEERIKADGWGQVAIERKEKEKGTPAGGLRLGCCWAGPAAGLLGWPRVPWGLGQS